MPIAILSTNGPLVGFVKILNTPPPPDSDISIFAASVTLFPLNLIFGVSLDAVVSIFELPDATIKLVPSKVRPDSASKVFAVPEPVITLLSALLFIVVPETLAKAS